MSFFIITYGGVDVEEIFCGITKEAVVEAARSMIDCWPEYRELEPEEIIDLVENEEILEFDLVEIPESFPDDVSFKNLRKIYEHYHSGIQPRPPRY